MMEWAERRSHLKYMNTLGGGCCAVIWREGVCQLAVRTIGMAAKCVTGGEETIFQNRGGT